MTNKDKQDKDITNTHTPTDNDSINDKEIISNTDSKDVGKKKGNTGKKGKTRKTGVGSRPLKRLSANMELFCRHMAKGFSAGESYLKAYPRLAKESWSVLGHKGRMLAHRPLVAKRIDELRKIERAKMEAIATWDKVDSILALKKVVESNIGDIERVQSVINDEIKLIESMMQEAIKNGDQKEAGKLLDKLFTKRKQRASNMVNNVGVVSAVSELNTLQGLYPDKDNGNNTNVTATVVFKNEDQLLD